MHVLIHNCQNNDLDLGISCNILLQIQHTLGRPISTDPVISHGDTKDLRKSGGKRLIVIRFFTVGILITNYNYFAIARIKSAVYPRSDGIVC